MASTTFLQNLGLELAKVYNQHDKFLGDRPAFSHYQGWLVDATVMIAINVGLWLLSLVAGKCWPVDFIWSSWPGTLAGLILYRSPLKVISPKQYLYLAVIWFWGLRLTANFVFRGGIGHEDWRYAEMREAIGNRWFPLLSLPMVFLGQSTFNFLGCLSIYGMMRNRFSVMGPTDVLGLFIVVCAVVLETAADEQLDEFTKAKKTEGSPIVLKTGVWSWSRHPNYFGELSFWWGLWVCGGCELGPSLAGPLGMTLLFFAISIPLMEERQLERKGSAFRAYQNSVPSSIVPIPPFLARILCAWRGRRQDNEEEEEEEVKVPPQTQASQVPKPAVSTKKERKKDK